MRQAWRGAIQRMNWFRSKMRSGAQLALFALAVQMVVSFGHMHGDDLGLPPLATSDQTQIESATTGAPGVCTENLIRVDEVRESHKLTRCLRLYASVYGIALDDTDAGGPTET